MCPSRSGISARVGLGRRAREEGLGKKGSGRRAPMEGAMEREAMLVRCVCGWEATGTEDELVAATQEHGRRIHNMLATREEVLAMVVPGGAEKPPGSEADVAS
jgi:predicted small metal-binding protein